MRRLPIPQHEFGFAAETFNLIQDCASDGERIARDRAEIDAARQAAERKQRRLFSRKTRRR